MPLPENPIHTLVSLGTREDGGAAANLMLNMLQWFPLVSPITSS